MRRSCGTRSAATVVAADRDQLLEELLTAAPYGGEAMMRVLEV